MAFNFKYVLLTVIVLCFASSALAAEVIQLPAPQTSGGAGIFDMLSNRASAPGASFPSGDVSHEELSTLLWAATGLNRPERGWTVPMAMGRAPYVRVYVTGEEGTFRYDWQTNSLIRTSDRDARSEISGQGFVANSSYVLIFVTDGDAIAGFGDRGEGWGAVAVGAMTQNVYLAAEALGIGARYLANLRPEVVREICGLSPLDFPHAILPIGKR